MHNLILAVASEGGAIGLFFLLLSGIAIVRGRRSPKSLEHLTALSLAVFYFGASQFSGGFYDCRWLWVLGALYLLPATTRQPAPSRSRLGNTRPEPNRERKRPVVAMFRRILSLRESVHCPV